MITVFVLDVPEFLSLVEHARSRKEFRVTGPAGGYFRLDASRALTLVRKTLGFKPAVWHGVLTGGMVGTISHFDNDTLTIVESIANSEQQPRSPS